MENWVARSWLRPGHPVWLALGRHLNEWHRPRPENGLIEICPPNLGGDKSGQKAGAGWYPRPASDLGCLARFIRRQLFGCGPVLVRHRHFNADLRGRREFIRPVNRLGGLVLEPDVGQQMRPEQGKPGLDRLQPASVGVVFQPALDCAGFGCAMCGDYPDDGDCPDCTTQRACAPCEGDLYLGDQDDDQDD